VALKDAGIINALTSSSVTLIELYRVTLGRYNRLGYLIEGKQFTFANHTSEIQWGGESWLPASVTRSEFEAKIDLEIQELSIRLDNIRYDIATQIESITPIGGVLDLYIYISEIQSALHISSALVRSVKVVEEAVEITLASGLDSIFEQLPRRKYYPNCPWKFLGTECGLTEDSVPTVTGTLKTSDTESIIDIAVEATRTSYAGGTFEITNGANKGFSAGILSHSETQITIIPPLPYVNAGDKFKAIVGCNKSYQDCRNKARFGGFPIIPIRVMI